MGRFSRLAACLVAVAAVAFVVLTPAVRADPVTGAVFPAFSLAGTVANPQAPIEGTPLTVEGTAFTVNPVTAASASAQPFIGPDGATIYVEPNTVFYTTNSNGKWQRSTYAVLVSAGRSIFVWGQFLRGATSGPGHGPRFVATLVADSAPHAAQPFQFDFAGYQSYPVDPAATPGHYSGKIAGPDFTNGNISFDIECSSTFINGSSSGTFRVDDNNGNGLEGTVTFATGLFYLNGGGVLTVTNGFGSLAGAAGTGSVTWTPCNQQAMAGQVNLLINR